MTAAVMIPYRDSGCEHRQRNFDAVIRYWTRLKCEIVIGSGPSAGPFNRAAAINEGVRKTQADVIYVSDADSLVAPAVAQEALELAAVGEGLVIAHDRFLYLDLASTLELLPTVASEAGLPVRLEGVLGFEEEPGAHGVGNALAFHREVWRSVGGCDERFEGWGFDDGAFATCVGVLVGHHVRLPADMYHLWHPRDPHATVEAWSYVDGQLLCRRYEEAAKVGPDAVRKVLAEHGPLADYVPGSWRDL